MPAVIYKFESELTDRPRAEGNVIHRMDRSIPKTKNGPCAQEDTISPGAETTEDLVPVALLEKA